MSGDTADRDLTPMLRHYRELKSQHPDALLLYRLGDFYEMFFDDAREGAELLDIALTSRDGTVPMCGVPHQSLESHLAKLVAAGRKVAICEQMEDPAQAKGLVRREIVRIVTPGTLTEERILDEGKNNFLAALFAGEDRLVLALTDLSTGEFRLGWFPTGEKNRLLDELHRWNPAEGLVDSTLDPGLREALPASTLWTARDKTFFDPERGLDLYRRNFGGEPPVDLRHPALMAALGAILDYLFETQRTSLAHLRPPEADPWQEYLPLDPRTRRHLELVGNERSRDIRTLLDVLDETDTAGGARWLRRAVERPLARLAAVEHRQDAVAELIGKPLMHAEIRGALKGFADLERILARLAVGRHNPRDFLRIRDSLVRLPLLKEALANAGSGLLAHLREALHDLSELRDLLRRALADTDTLGEADSLLAPGFNPELDRLRSLAETGRQWLATFEQRERERTGIRALRIGYNRVFGYYLEVSRGAAASVPSEYERRQTLANAERFVTPELKAWEEERLAAESRREALVQELFAFLRNAILEEGPKIQATAAAVAELDGISSLATVAKRRGYTRPELTEEPVLEIREGRHPVLEARMGTANFVPNDLLLHDERRLIVITGPNMGGKSTYLRQTALIVIMAQMGGFVPAGSARLGIVDQIFTRIGASDDLNAGDSTFMVEMKEVSHLLARAGKRSLVLLDEIGRGTSTFDGLSLAWAVAEYLHDHLEAKSLLATHYHELIELADRLPYAVNVSVAVREEGEGIRFLRRVVPGGSDKSYGLHVARLAGLPERVVTRAEEVLAGLEISRPKPSRPRPVQLALVPPPPDPILEELDHLDIWRLSPLEALNVLARWQTLRKGGGQAAED